MSRITCFRPSVLALALLVGSALPAEAQTAAELQAQRDSAQRRFLAIRSERDSAANAARAVPDDSLLLHGSIVRFNSVNLTESEQLSVTRAFDAAAAELIGLFGAEGLSLMKDQVWLVSVSRSSKNSGFGLDALENGARTSSESFDLPLRIHLVASAVRRQAGRNLVRRQPITREWAGGFAIAEPSATHYFAHRQLALHQSTPARRCARGNIPSCAAIFSPAAREKWFDATDAANKDRSPTSGIVRESVLRYAVDLNGPAVLRAFQAAASDSTVEPVQFIAAAVGQQSDEFLSGWQEQLAASGAVRVRASSRTVLAAMGWFALCGFIATRRRPQ